MTCLLHLCLCGHQKEECGGETGTGVCQTKASCPSVLGSVSDADGTTGQRHPWGDGGRPSCSTDNAAKLGEAETLAQGCWEVAELGCKSRPTALAPPVTPSSGPDSRPGSWSCSAVDPTCHFIFLRALVCSSAKGEDKHRPPMRLSSDLNEPTSYVGTR